MKKDKIIITGGAGFVGSNLISFFLKKTNLKIISLDNYSTGNIKNHIKHKRIKYFKHSSIISFTKKALNNFCKLKQSPLEIIEGVELLRAVENNFKIGTFILNDKSFSDVFIIINAKNLEKKSKLRSFCR